MFLSTSEIKRNIKERNLIENFEEKCIQSAGYDLRVGKFYTLKSKGKIGINERNLPDIEEKENLNKNFVEISPYEYLLVKTIEKVNMPENLVGFIFNRSSLFRCGCTIISAIVDPGYKGELTIGLKNLNNFKHEIEKGARIAQIAFSYVEGEVKIYNGKYQYGRVV